MLLNRLNNLKLRKIKSKMIVEALKTGASESGNHKVVCKDGYCDDFVFDMLYRGTVIAKVSIYDKGVIARPVYAGEYDNTVATIRQRRDIDKAVRELEKAVVVC